MRLITEQSVSVRTASALGSHSRAVPINRPSRWARSIYALIGCICPVLVRVMLADPSWYARVATSVAVSAPSSSTS
jgi:hypothetical protein